MTKNLIIPNPLLEYWIGLAPGAFHVSLLSNDNAGQQVYIDKLEKFVEQGILDRYGDKRGWYIPRKVDLVEMDFINCVGEPVDIWLPFGLSDLVEIYHGNVIMVSGAPNAGKTTVMLNIIRENRHKGWDISYFNSEMSEDELQKRLLKFHDIALDKWGFKAYHRSDRFGDVVRPGKNSLNIIDFLEVHDEFYVVGKRIKEIHDRLDGAIAVIGLQKNPGQDAGLGGYRSMEVTRLALAIDHGRVKVSKAKNFRQPDKNPNGLMRDFKIVQGANIIEQRGWYKENGKEKHSSN